MEASLVHICLNFPHFEFQDLHLDIFGQNSSFFTKNEVFYNDYTTRQVLTKNRKKLNLLDLVLDVIIESFNIENYILRIHTKPDRNLHKFTVSKGCVSSTKKPLPIYAAYLYDSVMLYAKALANVTSTKNVNGESIISSKL